MTVPQGNVRFSCHVGRIRSSVPLRPTFEDNETWYCGTAIAVPYMKLHKVGTGSLIKSKNPQPVRLRIIAKKERKK